LIVTALRLIALPVFVLLFASLETTRAADNAVSGAKFDEAKSIAFPPSHAIVDITKSPYNAAGDGVTDDG